ncbi:MAG: NTP transferase domain-containing protein, partial [Novosphingobium sp.]
MASIAFVVLGAGAARRFGGRKLDADLNGKVLGRWATDAVEKTGATDRFIVVQPDPPDFVRELNGWHLISNAEYERGIGTSIHAAITA